jgi:uncharacterized protein YfaS (alpha-2-macroglobulin family)
MKKLALLLLFVLAFSCKDNTSDKSSNITDFNEYIATYTRGNIPTKSEITVVLKKPQEDWTIGKELSADLLTIKPAVEGKIIAKNNRTLSFVPSSKLKNDTEYNIDFHLSKIVPVKNDKLKHFSFKVKTIKQDFSVYTGTINSYSKDWQYLIGNINTNDQMTAEDAATLITATQNGKKLTITWDNSITESNHFPFTIDSIQRFEDDSKIIVKWNGSKLDIDNKGEFKKDILGKATFKVLAIDVVESPTQYIQVNFTDPLKKNQNFKGLVKIAAYNGRIKYTVDGNVLKVYPRSKLKGQKQITVYQGIKSIDNYKIKKTATFDATFEQLNPAIRFLGKGAILPNSNNLKLNFEAVNLKAVDITIIKIFENNILQFLQNNDLSNGNSNLRQVGRPIAKKTVKLQKDNITDYAKWNAFAIDLSKLIKADAGAIYRVELKFKKQYAIFDCGDNDLDEEDETASAEINYDEEASDSSYWDSEYGYYDDYNYYYDWRNRDNPCSRAYYSKSRFVSKNIIASDLGVIAKVSTNNTATFAVSNILTAQAESGASIQLLNYQQQELGRIKTNGDGFASIKLAYKPYFAIVSKGAHKTYVKLNDGTALSLSKFDVTGVKSKKGLKGYIYGERGVWRPGDDIFLTFVLNDNGNPLPKGHPVKLELTDPQGKLVHRMVKTNGINGFYNFNLKTTDDAATGNWTAKIKVGGASFTKTLKIETIKPNRIKIKMNFDDEVLGKKDKIEGDITALWLHGAVAKNLEADTKMKLHPTKTKFKGFPSYVFDDPTRKFYSEEYTVYEGTLNKEGKTTFSYFPEIGNTAAGMLRASFITKVYEKGGDFSTSVTSKTYSPYNTYIGLLRPKGDKARNMLLTDQKHTFNVVALDVNAKPKANKRLKVKVYHVGHSWWWDASENNLSSYIRRNSHTPVFETYITTNSKGKADFKFEIKKPEWGRYLVRVSDEKGGHATGETVFIDWPGWAGRARKGDPDSATMLIFNADKTKYNSGESAEISFPSAQGARALVSVENGAGILQQFWLDTQNSETKFTLPITKDMAPNIYVYISLIQKHANTQNDMPIRMYGVIPISVEDKDTRLHPKINMPDVLEPEQTVKVKVSEQNGKPMTYTIAMIDEGLLDLTNFRTPNAWNEFYARQALGVKTWDMYDDVLGAYGGTLDQVFGIGGDGSANGAKAKKANRFKPVVTYLGPFELKKGQSKTHEIKLPNYVGSVRTMVIAGNKKGEAYGAIDKATPVRKPLMLLASLPRKLTPSEKVTLPITIFAMEKHVKDVTVSLKFKKGFRIIGEKTQTIHFANPDEKMVYFNLETADFTGISSLEVIAKGNGEQASYQVEIDIVNPNPIASEYKDIVLEPNSTQTLSFNTFGVAGTNTATLEASTLPNLDFSSRMNYLIQYPHGCVEQTTSSVFPQLFLSEIFDISSAKKAKVEYNIKKGIQRLAGFQTVSGGLSYWPGQNNANDWGTSYAGHFMLEAEKKGYALPLTFKKQWINYQKNQARQWRSKGNKSYDLAQAYRLYTLALADAPDLASMNNMREASDISETAKWRLAAAYALAGQKTVASKIINSLSFDFGTSKYDSYTYGSAYRNQAMALETLSLIGDKLKGKDLAKNIAENLASSRWMSTQSTAYSLLALAKYAKTIGGKGVQIAYKLNNSKNHSLSTAKTAVMQDLTIQKGTNEVKITNNKDNVVFVRVLYKGKLPVGTEQTAQRGLIVTADYKDLKGNRISINQIQQGTDFVAEIQIANKTGRHLKDVALTEIFPSGWEIVNTRFTAYGASTSNKADYIDMRDDRVNFYFDMKGNNTKVFRILLNASYLGKYYLPGIQAEAMYDNDYFVRNKGQWVEVVK